jgi:DNA polymerase
MGVHDSELKIAQQNFFVHLCQIAQDFAIKAPLSPRHNTEKNLSLLAERVTRCRQCRLAGHRQRTVFGVGNVHAQLMLVGEGPGAEEDRQGEPFVGPAGMLLNRMLLAMGLKREEVYIANIVKCRPPQNRAPETEEIAACFSYLQQQIEWIQPKIILLLGRVAAQTVLSTNTPISRLRGRFFSYQGILTMATFHPAYLLREPASKRLAWEDLQQVMERMKRLNGLG